VDSHGRIYTLTRFFLNCEETKYLPTVDHRLKLLLPSKHRFKFVSYKNLVFVHFTYFGILKLNICQNKEHFFSKYTEYTIYYNNKQIKRNLT